MAVFTSIVAGRMALKTWVFPWGSAWLSTVRLPRFEGLKYPEPEFETLGGVHEPFVTYTDSIRRYDTEKEAQTGHRQMTERLGLQIKPDATAVEVMALLEKALERNEWQ